MANVGIDLSLQGLQAALGSFRGLFEKLESYAKRGIEVDLHLKEQQIALGPAFGKTIGNEIAQQTAKVNEAAKAATGGVGQLNNALEVQEKVLSESAAALALYNDKIIKSNLPISEQAAALRNLKSSITSTIAEIKRIIKANDENKTATDASRRSMLGMIENLTKLRGTVSENQTAIGQLKSETKRLGSAQRETSQSVDEFNKRIAIAIGKLLRYRIAFFILRGAMDAVRDSVKKFVDVQDTFAQLNKVLTPIASNMTELREIGFNFAQTYAKGTEEVINVFKLWAQTGLNQIQVIQATKAALKGANAVNIESTQVVEALTSAIFAYGVEADRTTEVVDKWIAVQAKFPVVAKDLLDALKTIGVVAKDFGITIDDLNGIVAGVGAVTRKTGSQIAQSLKTILARLPREETIKAFQQVGVAVLSATGEIRPFLDIISDLSVKWKNLTDIQKANLSTTAGGIRRYVDFTALLNNFAVVQSAVAESIGSGGAASRAAGLQLATLKSTIDRAKAAFEALGFTVGQELAKPIRFFLDVLTDLATAFRSASPAVVKLTAGFISFISLSAIFITISKAVGFVLDFLKHRMQGTAAAAAEQKVLFDAAGQAVKSYTVAVEGAAGANAALGSSMGATAAGGLFKIIGKFNAFLIILSAAISLLSILTFKTKEYQNVIDDTADSVDQQARSLFGKVLKIQKQEESLQKNLVDRLDILKQLGDLEGKTDATSIANRKALEANLKGINTAIGNALPTLRNFLEQSSKLGIEKQINAQEKLVAGSEELHNSNLGVINSYNDIYRALQSNRAALEAQLKIAEDSQTAIVALLPTIANLFKKPTEDATAFNLAIQDIGLAPEFVRSIKDAKEEVGGFLGEVLKNKGKSDIIIPEKSVAALKLAEKAIKDFKVSNANLLEQIQPTVSETRYTQISDQLDMANTSLDQAYANTVNKLGLIGDAYRQSEKTPRDYARAVEDTNKALSSFGALLVSSQEIVSGALGNSITAAQLDIDNLKNAILQISFDNVISGASSLDEARGAVEGIIHDFRELDLSQKFIKDFDKISAAVKDAAKNVREDLRLKGVEQDAETTAKAIQSAYIQQLKSLRTLINSLDAQINESESAINKITAERERLGTGATKKETKKLNDEEAKATANINNLNAQRAVIIGLIPILEKDIVNKLLEQVRILKQLTVEDVKRASTLDRINLFYEQQAKLAELAGARADEIAKIDRARIIALAKEKIAQTSVVQNTETVANILKITNQTILDLAKNAQQVSIANLEKELKRIQGLAGSLQTALASAFTNINANVIKGIDERFRITEDIRQTEFDLQEAIKKGDQDAINSAKVRLKELRAELSDFKKVLFEVKQFGADVFTGLATAINQALAQKFTSNIVELAIDDTTLGDKVAKAILGVNQASLEKTKEVYKTYLAALASIQDFSAKEIGEKILKAHKDGAQIAKQAIIDGHREGLGKVTATVASSGPIDFTQLESLGSKQLDATNSVVKASGEIQQQIKNSMDTGLGKISNVVASSGPIDFSTLESTGEAQVEATQSVAQATGDVKSQIKAAQADAAARLDAIGAINVDSKVTLKQTLESGFNLLKDTLAGVIGVLAGGGTPSAQAGGQIGALAGKAGGAALGRTIGAGVLGGVVGFGVGALVGGFIGGLFGGKRRAKEFVPSIQANTDALRQNTLAIEQLEKRIINAPSNFNIPNFPFGGQSPAPQFNITVAGVSNPDQFVDQVINRIQKDYSRSVRTGSTRRTAL